MTRQVSIALLAIALVGAVAAAAKEGRPAAVDLQAAANQFIDQLAAGEFDKAVEQFDQTMTGAMPAEKLDEIWGTIQAQAGRFLERTGVRTAEQGPYRIVLVSCRFERKPLDTKIVFDDCLKDIRNATTVSDVTTHYNAAEETGYFTATQLAELMRARDERIQALQPAGKKR